MFLVPFLVSPLQPSDLYFHILPGGEAGFPIGDTTAFIGTLSLTLPIYYAIKNKGSNKKKSILAGSIATVSLTITMTILNWLVVAPLYMKVMGFSVGPMREYLTLSVIPFNLVKGVLVSLIFFVVFYQIQGYLNKLKNKNNPIDLNISEIK